MEPITSSLSNEQLPLYKEFLHTLNEENKKMQECSPLSSYQLKSDSANFFSKQDFSWEYFSNELEFE